MYPLNPSIVRLVALSMAHKLLMENTPDIVIIDPYYMKEMFLSTPRARAKVTRYIEDCFKVHSSKSIFLLPYFPESLQGN